jgi:hypothetical protein
MNTILLYVDPGSGSYLVQMLIAAILGGLFYFKTLIWSVRNFFSRKKSDNVILKKKEDE